MLARRVSVAALIEMSVWLAGGYLVVGMIWSMLHADDVQRLQARLEQQLRLPPGTDYGLVAFSQASVVWPVLAVLPSPSCAQ